MVPLRSIPAAALLLCGAALGQAQRVAIEPRPRGAVGAPPPESFRNANFRLDVKLIQIPVTVTDQKDHPVLGLPKSSFRVFEDNV